MNGTNIRNTAIVICVVGLAGFGLLTYQQYYLMKQSEEKFRKEEKKMADLKTELAAIEKFLKQYDKEKEDFSKLLFKERDIPAFLDKISEYAKVANVSIIDMKTKKFQEVKVPEDKLPKKTTVNVKDDKTVAQKKKEELKKILTLAAMPIEVKVEGTFQSLVNFLDELQNYNQLLSVSSVEISVTSEYPTLKCEFTLRIYSLKTLEELKNL